MQQGVGRAQPGQDPTLARRVEELERRVATLEREAKLHLDAAVPVPYPKEAAYPEQGAATEEPEAIGPLPEAPIPTAPAPTAPAPSSGAPAVRASAAGAARESGVGVVYRRQRADAHRRRHHVLRRRVSAQILRRAFHGIDRAAPCRRGGLRGRADRARAAPGGIASRLRSFAAGRRRGNPLPHDLRRVPALRRAARGAGDRAARCRGGTHDRARGARRFAAARGVGDRRRISCPDAGRQRRRPLAAVRLLRRAERRDLRARLVQVLARAQRRGLRLHVRAGLGVGSRVLRRRALRDRAAVPGAVLRLLRRHRDPQSCGARRPRQGTRSTACWCSAFRSSASRCRRRSCTNTTVAPPGARSRSRSSMPLLFVAMRKRVEPGYPLLSRAFAALAVIFATVAIPFAFDDRYTAAIWAVEAAGVYWIGVRQNAGFARAFALLVEVGAGILFAISGAPGTDDLLFANAYFAGAILIAAAGLATACIADRATTVLNAAERALVPAVLGWGVLWWLAAGGIELVRHLPRAEEPHAVLAWVTASVALALASSRCAGVAPARWRRRWCCCRQWPSSHTSISSSPAPRSQRYGWIVWPCAWIVHWRALARGRAAARGRGRREIRGGRHRGACWTRRMQFRRFCRHRADRLGS